MKEDLLEEHQIIELEEEDLKDLSNPASQDYVIEKLKDMENNRLSKQKDGSNESSERFVPKQVNMPDCDSSDVKIETYQMNDHQEIQ